MCRSYTSLKQSTMSMSPPSSAPVGNASTTTSTSTSSSPASASPARSLAQHISLLHNIMRTQRWSAFENIVLSNPAVFGMISATIPEHEELKAAKSTLLHAVLKFSPPPKVVVRMVRMFTSNDRIVALRARDAMGRTPLHIAAASGCDAMVIKLLGHADPATCDMVDVEGRTALHLACDSSCNTEATEPQQPSYDSICALLSESLASTLVEDSDEMSPLEYAIVSDASIEVVNLLQKATMECSVQNKQRATKRRRLSVNTAADVTSPSVEMQQRSVVRKVSVSCQM